MRQLRAVTIVTLLLAGSAALAAAQGGMGGGMGRGEGMGGQGMGGGPRGDGAEAIVNRFEQMGELKPVLAKLDLSAAQRDSIGRIELACGNQLCELANTVRSFGSQGRPAVDSLRTLQEHANVLRDREWAAVRAYIPEPLRGRFDENVNRVRDDEARREQDLRSGRGRRGDDMNGPPPAGEQGAREM